MAIYPLKTFDTFSRTASSTWGSTDNAQGWNGDTESHWSTDGNFGKIVVSSSTFPTYDLTYINLANYGGVQGSAEVLTLVKWEGTAAYPNTDHGPVLSYTANNFYFVRIQDNYNEVAITCLVDGVMYELNRTSKDISKDTLYWVRFRRSSGQLRAKIWAKGTAEPSAWTLTSNEYGGSNPPPSGSWGYIARKTTDTYTVYVDTFYGYTLEDEAVNTTPITDSFEREVYVGWGINSLGQVWEGNVSVDPAIRSYTDCSLVTDPSDGYGQITIPDEYIRAGIIGPSVSGNIETYTTFSLNSSAGSTQFLVGARGEYQVTSGIAEYKGYYVRISSGGTQLTLHKITAFGGASTQLTSTTTNAHMALVSNSKYHVRFQIVGTTLQARIWLDGNSEPATWNVAATDSSITSGRLWVGITQNSGVTTTRTLKVYNVEYGAPTAATTVHTTVGSITSTAITDTTLALRAAFTNDTNSDNSLVVEYKKSSDTSWTTFGGTKTRSSTYYSFTLTSLLQNTAYDVRCTFSDADSVLGTNPSTASFTTTDTGLVIGSVSVANVGSTTLDLYASYTADTDNDSTASYEYRISSFEEQPINDTFFGGSGTLLQDHATDVGGEWIKHPTSGSANFELWSGRTYARTTSTSGLSYYVDTAIATSEYEVSADIYVAAKSGRLGVMGRLNSSALTGYIARYETDTNTVSLYVISAGTFTLLGTYDITTNVGDTVNIKLILKDAYKAVEVDGIERIRSTNNAVTASGYAGIRSTATSTVEGSASNQLTMDNFIVTYRTASPSWTSGGSMTANRGALRFESAVSGLTSDAVYEFRVTYVDSDGVSGSNPQHVVVMTIGQAVGLLSVGATEQATSLVVSVVYEYDTNNNSELAIQYRSLMDYLWTTVPPTQISVNRGAKTFSTTLVSLRPHTTYEVKATISDPNGIVEGALSEIITLLTTDGFTVESEKESKHYLWKVYNRNNEYITTWHDAGEPEFSWHENGGVSDLGVTLPRKISSTENADSGIGYQYRIDVWAFDPSSDGFGLNLSNDPEFELGAWTLGSNATISSNGGPDGSSALKIVAPTSAQEITREKAIYIFRQLEEYNGTDTIVRSGSTAYSTPLVIKGIARARGSKLLLFAEAYDQNDVKIEQSEDFAETVGSEWQTLRFEYTPPTNAVYIRVCAQNDGKGTMWLDKVSVRSKEVLIYRGRIESFTPKIDQKSEEIDVQILGLVSLLSDDYIEFLQFVTTQPQKDFDADRTNYGASDPSDMLKAIIDQANAQNPQFALYYTAESIRSTGNLMQYTFRDQQIRACFDKVRSLCPSGWHYYIEPDGLVVLRGPEHAPTHTIRLGVEIMNFSVERSIRNLKNFVHVKGRQDEDNSEPDGYGSIHYIAFDQESIDKYGKRMLFIRDSNITDPSTAELVGDGRLVEYNREEQRAQCNIPDDKSIDYVGGALRGFNIEQFRPGDNVIILDPIGGPNNTYWDQLVWDADNWDSSNAFSPLPESVPIKTFQFHGTFGMLELSERQPSSVGDFGRLYRWLQLSDADNGD